MKLALYIATICAIFAAPALAQQNCGPYTAIAEELAGKHGKSVRVRGLASNNTVMEIWASESGEWTVVILNSEGTACIPTMGSMFHVLPGGDPA